METKHDSVLFDETLEWLDINPGDTVVDATLGGAGHFKAILAALGPQGALIGIDADADAIARAQKAVDGDLRCEKPTIYLIEGNFRNLAQIIKDADVGAPDKLLFDLGWSSFQLTRGRGFSFKSEEPLLMTYGNPEEAETAADIVNSATEEELADIIYTYGEERFARGIARAIVRERKGTAILTTADLVSAIEKGTPSWYHHRRLHPATKTFQALRIAVNDELGALREGLAAAIASVAPGGRIGVITFHSIEDRIVKGMFRDAAYAGKGCLGSKKPIVPSEGELERNPRARSAKLRVFFREDVAPHKSSLFHNHVAYV